MVYLLRLRGYGGVLDWDDSAVADVEGGCGSMQWRIQLHPPSLHRIARHWRVEGIVAVEVRLHVRGALFETCKFGAYSCCISLF